MVHGSGASDRDETVGANKPFRDLAYGLAERGIAVIRYDKRTKVYGADSAPAGKEITFDEESVDDALSAIKLARSIPTINPERIYILGHSLGGTLAPRIVQRSDKVPAGIILLAGAARPLEDLFISQVKFLASALPSTKDNVIIRSPCKISNYGNPPWQSIRMRYLNLIPDSIICFRKEKGSQPLLNTAVPPLFLLT